MRYERGWHLGVYYPLVVIVLIITLAFITITIISTASIAKGFLRHSFMHLALFTLRYMDHNK